ncbi:MAG: iron ABC transporter permease [Phycisphaerales bacterium]
MQSAWRQRILLGLLLALLGAGLLYPIALTVGSAFEGEQGGFTLHHVASVFGDPATRRGLVNATIIACVTTTLALLVAFPLALVGARCRFPGKTLLSGLLLLPLVLPPFVGAIGVRHLLGRAGAFNALLGTDIDWLGAGGMWAIAAMEAISLYPILYLNIMASLANLDPALEEAAQSLGAGRWTRLRRVTLPLVRPGVFAGATIVFIWSFTELGTPLMFEYYDVTSVQIFNGIKEVEASRRPYALVVVMLLFSVGFYLLGKWTLGRASYTMQSKASIRREELQLTGARALGAMGLFGAVAAVASLPAIGVILASLCVPGQWYGTVLPSAWTLGHYEQALTHPLAAGSIRNSLILAGIAVLLAVVVGFITARLLVRSNLRGRWALDGLVMLPLAVPGLVLAFGYVAASLAWPFAGTMPGWLQPLVAWLPAGAAAAVIDAPLAGVASVVGASPNPFPFLVVAYAVRRLPYVVRSAVAGLQQTSAELEEAGRVAGAGRWLVQRRLVIPLIAANLVAGALLAFSFSMLEVSDSLLLAQRESDYPVTKAIYTLFERLGDGPGIASAMGVWAMALLAVTLLGASALIGKRMGAIFRA